MPPLADIATQEIALLTAYIDLLEQEQDILKRGEAPALAEVCERKTRLVEQLNDAERARCEILTPQDGEDMRSAMARWQAQHPEETRAGADWATMLDLARQARQLHDQNAQLTRLLLQQTSELLTALTRQPPTQMLYGSNGQAWQGNSTRIIDSA